MICARIYWQPHRDAENLKGTNFLIKMTYVFKLLERLNKFNKSLQENETHILQLADTFVVFQKELLLWKSKREVEQGNTDSVSVLQGFVKEKTVQYLEPSLKLILIQHSLILSTHFDNYFPEKLDQYDSIRDPFQSNPPPSALSIVEK